MGRLTQADRDWFGVKGDLNIRFDIERGRGVFYETAQPADSITVFPTFEEAKAAAVLAYRQNKNKQLAKLEKNEKVLLAVTEDEVFGYNPDGGW